ncbi:IpaD/SipD/SspD family type III secretion system needle tip protein [Proteus mirabilis]|uniref:IpaD/SipD/SspD family type III secretion system needle tip protein n=1 Tax=Proteus mirabilis TaxID=584 RepID=UPI001C2C078E|nr:IpaD/SipD/SspD family type III secretion system needle tip protein [Proteus mirabilis]MBU9978107.1 IpaD/SipD/SspD family type III secretion system needle tip protein [Proteus mirabilis]
MSKDISIYTEGINNLSHLNARVNSDDYFEKLLEYKNSLSWDPNRKYQSMNSDNNRKNKFIEELPDTDKYYYLDDFYNKTINGKNNFLNQFSNDLNNIQAKDNSYETDSLSDLFNNVKQSIISGKEDYLDVLKDIFSNYMNFVNELRQTISNLNKYQKAGSKEGMVHFDFKSFFIDLSNIRDKYKNPTGSVDDPFVFKSRLFFQHQKDGTYVRTIDGQEVHYNDKQQVNNATDALENLLRGIKGIVITRDNRWSESDVDVDLRGKIDCTDLETLLNDLSKKTSNTEDIQQTEFELFRKTIDSLDKKINTNLDELSKKYSTANSNYDNFVKIVSSTMNTLLEMAKGFLRF